MSQQGSERYNSTDEGQNQNPSDTATHDAPSSGVEGSAEAANGSAAGASLSPGADSLFSQPARELSEEEMARESELREALRNVVDPEINLDIVTLGLVREIRFDADADLTEVGMILTTPFCPYAGVLVQQTKDVVRQVTGGEARVTLLDEPRWSPDLMEGGDWSEWGLI